MPVGGSTVTGALGYVAAMAEILDAGLRRGRGTVRTQVRHLPGLCIHRKGCSRASALLSNEPIPTGHLGSLSPYRRECRVICLAGISEQGSGVRNGDTECQGIAGLQEDNRDLTSTAFHKFHDYAAFFSAARGLPV